MSPFSFLVLFIWVLSLISFSIFIVSFLKLLSIRLKRSISFSFSGEFSWSFNWAWFLCFFILLIFLLFWKFRKNNSLLWSWRAVYTWKHPHVDCVGLIFLVQGLFLVHMPVTSFSAWAGHYSLMGVCPCGVWYPVWSSSWQWWLTHVPKAPVGSRSSSWLHLEPRMAVAKQLLQNGGDLQTLPLSLPADKQAGKHRAVALTICAYLSMFQLLQTGCYTLLQALRFPISQLISLPLGALPRLQETFLFHSSLPSVEGPSRFLSFFFSSLFFHLTQIQRDFIALSDAWDPLQHSGDILWEPSHM